jgi:hypothetical protein
MKNPEIPLSSGDPKRHPISAERRGMEVQKVLGWPRARPPGGAPPPVELPQLVAVP